MVGVKYGNSKVRVVEICHTCTKRDTNMLGVVSSFTTQQDFSFQSSMLSFIRYQITNSYSELRYYSGRIQDPYIKKLIEYHRIITMTEERLTKKSVIKAEQLLDDAYAILKKHNITYNNNQIKNQWRRLVQKKVNDTVNKEIMEESSHKTKLHNISGANAELKNYLKDLTWENSRTVFEVRTNMLQLNSNYGQKDEQCYTCGKQETTRHIFECEGSTVKKTNNRKIQTDDWKRRPTDRQHDFNVFSVFYVVYFDVK